MKSTTPNFSLSLLFFSQSVVVRKVQCTTYASQKTHTKKFSQNTIFFSFKLPKNSPKIPFFSPLNGCDR